MVKNMSDPAKNAEVEDVLSSIRRLVSEEKRPLQPAPRPEPKPGRLVLTPALRVEETRVPDMVENAVEEAVEAEVQAAFAAEEVAVDDAFDFALDVDGPLAPEDSYADDPYGFDDDTNLDGEALQETEGAPSSAEKEDQFGSTEVDTLSAKIAALETAIGEISDEWEPDGGEVDANAAEQASAMAWEEVEPAAEVVPEDVASEVGADPEPEPVFAHRLEPESETAPESEERAAEEVPEPQDVAAAPAEEITETDEPEPEVEAQHAEQEAGGTPAPFAMSPEDQLLDEDTLREMITEIVHAELQGAMGERITRNVRRLVRREIHRALTARELD